MDARLRRVNKEIAGRYSLSSLVAELAQPWSDCKNDKSSNIKIDLVDSSPFHLKGSFPGPQDTPYEGGHFEVVRIRDFMDSLCSVRRLNSHIRISSSPIRIRSSLSR